MGQAKTDLAVAGIRLGDRASAKALLNEYTPTTGDDGRPNYYFYNEPATQVMRLTGESFDDKFLIRAIEVFSVGESYRKAHFQLKDVNFFITDTGIFIGNRPSIKTQILGIPGVSRGDVIGPKDLVKRKGEPARRETPAEDREVLTYETPVLPITAEGQTREYKYTARYEFRDRKLKRFRIEIQ